MAEGSDAEMLDRLQRETFAYFLHESDPRTGLIVDKTQPGTPASIAVVGMGLTAYVIGIERALLTRDDAIERTLRVLRFLESSEQSKAPTATGYKGFYYHFLDMGSGRRAWKSELSTIDTALLMAGVLTSATYFSGDDAREAEIRRIAEALYRRVDWAWALDGQETICHGWTPEEGFLPCRWDKEYSEAHVLYVLALGSPSFSIGEGGYRDWIATFVSKTAYGIDYLYAGPLFIHQFSQLWLNLQGITDARNRSVGFDYFENSRRATLVHQKYAIDNPRGYAQYGEHCWGQTASDGPGPARRVIDGVERTFYGYLERGAPFGPDDGTVSPWAAVASLPFAPEIVIETVRHAIEQLDLKKARLYGVGASFNPTYPEKTQNPNGWVSPWQWGLNQDPIVIMLENFRSHLVWDIVSRCPHVVQGLRRAGFTGGWLDAWDQRAE